MSTWLTLGGLLLMVAVCSIVLSQACKSFAGAANWLGRKLPAGIKGATINAVCSSLPELVTTFVLLFFVGGTGVFAAGIAVSAGSAVFNSDVIPSLCIIAVCAPLTFRFLLRIFTFGMARFKSKAPLKVESIRVSKRVLMRDGVALVAAEAALITLLTRSTLTWIDGAILMSIYLPYVGFMYWQVRSLKLKAAEYVPPTAPRKNLLRAVATFDFNQILFRGRSYADGGWYQGWIVLACSTVVISLACYALGEAIVGSAELLHVHAMITGLFIGAAASSIPDTILSIRDAMNGNYDDAISNAVGSNTFNICIALGLPLFAYCLIYGPISVPVHPAVFGLQLGLIVVTVAILALFLIPKKVRLWQALLLFSLYIGWAAYILLSQ